LLLSRVIVAPTARRVKALITVAAACAERRIFCCKMPLATPSGKQKILLVGKA